MENINKQVPKEFTYTKEQLREVAYFMYRGKSQAEIGRRLNLSEWTIQKLSTIVMNIQNWEDLLQSRSHTREEMADIEDELFHLLYRKAANKKMTYDELQRMSQLESLYIYGQI